MPRSDDADVRVVVIDDHPLFAGSLARRLADEDGIWVLGTAGIGAEGTDLTIRLRPQVVLVDHQSAERDGVAVVAEIKRRDPTIMVLMVTGSTDDRVLLAAVEAGCSGFLTEDRDAAEVAQAVRSAAVGEAVIAPALLTRLLPQLNRTNRAPGADLTERDREILRLLARGWTNKAIASELYLSVNTVRNYVQHVLNKLGAHSKLEAVTTAVRQGIIDFPSNR